jgi:hypothetical protein
VLALVVAVLVAGCDDFPGLNQLPLPVYGWRLETGAECGAVIVVDGKRRRYEAPLACETGYDFEFRAELTRSEYRALADAFARLPDPESYRAEVRLNHCGAVRSLEVRTGPDDADMAFWPYCGDRDDPAAAAPELQEAVRLVRGDP